MGITSNKQPKPMSFQTAAIIIIAFTVVIATFYYLGVFEEFEAANPEPTQQPLTPARNLEAHGKPRSL